LRAKVAESRVRDGLCPAGIPGDNFSIFAHMGVGLDEIAPKCWEGNLTQLTLNSVEFAG
jgi:hypothetical protein